MKRLLILLVGLLFWIPIRAQVSISPTFLFIDETSRFETLLIMNGTDKNQEVSLSYEFGYPVSDSLGNIQMQYSDTENIVDYSIADWIKGFPRNFALESGQRQVVRLTIRPDESLENDGMYWTRVKTTSTPESPPIGAAPEGEVRTQINFKFEQVTTAFYKGGNLTTGLEI